MSFPKCRNNRNANEWFFILQNWKKLTSPAHEFLLYKRRNNRETKKLFYLSNMKKIIGPSNEFLLHNCRNKNGKLNYFSSNLENLQVLLTSLLHNCRNRKWIFPFQIWKYDKFSKWLSLTRYSKKNVQVHLMSFCYIGQSEKIHKSS